jgi:uncharacterized membrane protein
LSSQQLVLLSFIIITSWFTVISWVLEEEEEEEERRRRQKKVKAHKRSGLLLALLHILQWNRAEHTEQRRVERVLV